MAPSGAFLRKAWDARRVSITRWLGASVAIWAAYTLIAGEHGYLRERELREERRLQAERATALRREIGALRQDLDFSKEDPIRRERILREELGLAKPGEVVYHLVEANSGRPDVDESARFGESPSSKNAAEGPLDTGNEAR
jgi:cell division protein FtsB